MNHFDRPPTSGRRARWLALLVAGLVLAATGSADAKRRHQLHPGYVDGAHFVEFAESHGDLVEVTLHGRLLKLITQRAVRRADATLADLLAGLESMQAVVASLGDDAPTFQADRAQEIVRSMSRRLDEAGWERFVRVRERSGEHILAYVHLDREDEIDGLVVMGTTGKRELLFVNLTGRIDMAAVSLLGERFDLPGLDDLPGEEDADRPDGHAHLLVQPQVFLLRDRVPDVVGTAESDAAREDEQRAEPDECAHGLAGSHVVLLGDPGLRIPSSRRDRGGGV